MPKLNEEETACQNATDGCRATTNATHPGYGRVSDIEYEFVPDGYSNLYIVGREEEGPITLTSFHRNCPNCPNGVLTTTPPEEE